MLDFPICVGGIGVFLQVPEELVGRIDCAVHVDVLVLSGLDVFWEDCAYDGAGCGVEGGGFEGHVAVVEGCEGAVFEGPVGPVGCFEALRRSNG